MSVFASIEPDLPSIEAGWDLDEFTEGVRQRQTLENDGESVDLSDLGQTNTAIQEHSWGRVKAEAK